MGAISLLMRNKKLVGGVLLVILVLGAIGYHKIKVASLEHSIVKLETALQAEKLEVMRQKGEVKQCQAVVGANNDRINDLIADRRHRESTFKSLIDTVDSFKVITQLKIDQIESAPTPQSCSEAIELLRQGAQ